MISMLSKARAEMEDEIRAAVPGKEPITMENDTTQDALESSAN